MKARNVRTQFIGESRFERDLAVAEERARCVGIVLKAYAEQRLCRNQEIADLLDRLATRLEHPETQP